MDLLVGFHLHFARNGMLKHPIPYIGMDAQANLTVGSGEKRVVHYSVYVTTTAYLLPGQYVGLCAVNLRRHSPLR